MNQSSIFRKISEEATDSDVHRLRCDSQSATYYSDISHFLADRIKGFCTLSLLDVGTRTGSGLGLLRLMHHPRAFTRLKFHPVVGIDIDPAFKDIAEIEYPDTTGIVGDIFDMPDNCYDVVVCSHTIEHVADVTSFVKQLEKIARKYVLIACPFEERTPMSAGHIHHIDRNFLNQMGYSDIKVYESFHFHNGLCCIALKTMEF